MNRPKGICHGHAKPVPRARGDEPEYRFVCMPHKGLFPAHAGMNRRLLLKSSARLPVPRARGDEPTAYVTGAGASACSPRTRG